MSSGYMSAQPMKQPAKAGPGWKSKVTFNLVPGASRVDPCLRLPETPMVITNIKIVPYYLIRRCQIVADPDTFLAR
jgi:hypothetical protein